MIGISKVFNIIYLGYISILIEQMKRIKKRKVLKLLILAVLILTKDMLKYHY